MQATRQHILDHLQLAHGATVKELCGVLGLTATGVRQHLTILESEGFIESHEVRGKVGRPALRYELTRRGESMFPKGYDELANALIDEVRSSYGGQGLHEVVQGVAERLAAPHVEQFEGMDPAERLRAVCDLFAERGIVADWEPDGDAYLLHERTCPYPEVARKNSVSCAMEVEQVRLLTGMDARLRNCLVRGDEMCTYRLEQDGASPPVRGRGAS